MADGDEPTWGDSYAKPRPNPATNIGGPAGPALPNQQSMPVTGWGQSTPGVPGGQPHADYQRQAQQHFGQSQPNPAPPSAVSYPGAIPPIVNYPSATSYPIAKPPASTGLPSYSSYSLPTKGDSFVIRLMERGVRGELFRQPWFHNLRGGSPDTFVYATFGGGVFLSFLLALIPSTFFSTVMILALWAAIGYLYFALGTRLAHQFLEFGICLVGAVVMVGRVLTTLWALSVTSSLAPYLGIDPAPLLVLVLLVDLAAVAFLVYTGIQVHRGIQKLSQP
ncbi:hypothetical protein OG976_23365 [Mycobacterium sp. NBC_00419]|uniref:hypothetical protein n=1 Tax=Mycobacterium sp. NBC_00419 TaxID=2975989 RepID=UPI002E22BD32